MRKRTSLLLIILCNVFGLVAQTAADSLMLVSADWKVTTLRKGLVFKEAEFPLLYEVPQHVAILEISPEMYKFDILVHNSREKTSVAARNAEAVAAINGSYFNMKTGQSVCYLRKDGVVVDTTANSSLGTMSNGAVIIRKGKMVVAPWSKQDEKSCRLKRGSILVSGPLMLLDGKAYQLPKGSHAESRHPRSAVALMKDKKILLIAVDGRFAGKAEGINLAQLTHLIRVLGGKDALNLDGGGSTTLWSASTPGSGVLNKLCGNQLYDNEGERKVANSLCVYDK